MTADDIAEQLARENDRLRRENADLREQLDRLLRDLADAERRATSSPL